jgi:hypothetical protein
MINRIAHLLEGDEPPQYEYFELVASSGRFYLDRETGLALARQLERRWRPRWLRFTDLFGSTIVLRMNSVTALQESTPEQREAVRDFQRHERADELREWHSHLDEFDDDWTSWDDDDDICPV